MRIRRTLLATAAVAVVTLAALIPVGVFAAPAAPDPRSAEDRIPWELSGAVWSECPAVISVPDGYSIGSSPDLRGGWGVWLFDETGLGLEAEEFGETFPQLVEPVQELQDCLDRFPTTVYSEPSPLNQAQRQLYWSYLVGALTPCLRGHGLEVDPPNRKEFRSTDITGWYMESIHAWDESAPLEELLTLWRECPVYPSYLESASTRGVYEGP